MNQEQQQEIAEGLRAGNPAAWSRLFDEYAPQVWTFVARKMGNSAAGVADVVQETMVAAAASAKNYSSERGSLTNWLLGIANRQVASANRSNKRSDVLVRLADELHASGGRLGHWLDNAGEIPDDHLAQEETVELVHQALGRLPEEYNDLLTAKYLDDHSVAAIAMDRGMTVVSVQSKLARARKAFRDVFKKD